MNSTMKLTAACLAITAVTAARARADYFFTGLGNLHGESFTTEAAGVSADGSVVVGTSGNQAFRWTSGGGMVGLGSLLSATSGGSRANGVSADGSVVVGDSRIILGNGTSTEAFHWTAGGGMVGLGYLPGGYFPSGASGVSADGLIVVGSGLSANTNEAFRWTSVGGMVGLGQLPGGSFSYPFGVSADGSVIVGQGTTASAFEAFRWTAGGGMVGLGDLPGGSFYSNARGVSADGSVVVGTGSSENGTEAFRWTAGGGMVGLGDLAGGSFGSLAYGVSADGSVVVGQGRSTSGIEAFLWDESNGMRGLREVLIDEYGLAASLSGWELYEATAISADGLVIVGNGTNPNGASESWIANLRPSPAVPEPASLTMVATGVLGLLGHAWRRRRHDRKTRAVE